jgi:hypothetical protein
MSIAEFNESMYRLRRNVGPKASRNWMAMVARACVQLADRWGGPHILAWWLAERTEPVHRVTGAARDRMVRMCGRSRRALELVWDAHRATHKAGPGSSTLRREQRGWDYMDVTSYLALRLADA